jgi:hypothetical protein
MNLQNGYKVLYEVTADGKRTFYATKSAVCNPAVDDEIAKVTIGEYKLVYEKGGQIYGSTTGVPAAEDQCLAGFDQTFKVKTEGAGSETPAAATYTRRARKTTKATEEEPAVETTTEIG